MLMNVLELLPVICLLPESLDMALFMRSVSVSNIIRVDVCMEARPRRGDAAAMLARRGSRVPATEQSSILACAASAPVGPGPCRPAYAHTRGTQVAQAPATRPYEATPPRHPDTPAWRLASEPRKRAYLQRREGKRAA